MARMVDLDKLIDYFKYFMGVKLETEEETADFINHIDFIIEELDYAWEEAVGEGWGKMTRGRYAMKPTTRKIVEVIRSSKEDLTVAEILAGVQLDPSFQSVTRRAVDGIVKKLKRHGTLVVTRTASGRRGQKFKLVSEEPIHD